MIKKQQICLWLNDAIAETLARTAREQSVIRDQPVSKTQIIREALGRYMSKNPDELARAADRIVKIAMEKTK